MKYMVNGHEYDEKEIKEAIVEIIDNIDDDLYDELLDECYDEIEICGYSYSPSIVLYRVDPVAYNCGLSDWKECLYSDILDEVESMKEGETLDEYGVTVECVA